MHTENSIIMNADARTIYNLASQTDRWPDILPHYRWVKVLEESGNRRVVEMAARRDLIPVRWVAEQTNYADEPRIVFHHIGGVTKGMDVEWWFEPMAEGTRISILHDLTLNWPIIGTFAAERVIGPLFVANIAGKTLQRIKSLAEAQHRIEQVAR